MLVNEFFDKWNNRPCNPDGAYGNQCVDIADQYGVEVVNSPLPPVNGAKDFWNKNLVGYDKIANTPTNIPIKGDILIWGWGTFGHIAIFNEGDINRFTSFDQNFPTQGYYDTQGNFIGTGVCHFQEHTYDSVLGWFHPQKDVNTNPVKPSSSSSISSTSSSTPSTSISLSVSSSPSPSAQVPPVDPCYNLKQKLIAIRAIAGKSHWFYSGEFNKIKDLTNF